MVAIPDQLVWEVVKNNNSFLKKVNGRSKRSGTMRFSVEKGNLRSLSSYKHSGIANSKAVGVSCTDSNSAVLYTKTASKTASKTGIVEIPINKPFGRVVSSIEKNVADNYYRPDLKGDALAKFSKVYQANRISKGVKKTVPVKKGRN